MQIFNASFKALSIIGFAFCFWRQVNTIVIVNVSFAELISIMQSGCCFAWAPIYLINPVIRTLWVSSFIDSFSYNAIFKSDGGGSTAWFLSTHFDSSFGGAVVSTCKSFLFKCYCGRTIWYETRFFVSFYPLSLCLTEWL